MFSIYLSFSISITFISFIVGMLVTAALKKTACYDRNLSNLNFIKSRQLNRVMGLGIFKWIVRNTPFKYLNQRLKIGRKTEKSELQKLRQDMTSAEIDHLAGFLFVMLFALFKFYQSQFLFGTTIMAVNTVMNLYPSLLQQENKRRIDKMMKRFA